MSDQDWHDAGRHVFWAFESLSEATTLPAQASALRDLTDAVSDLGSFLPGYDVETHTVADPLEAS